MKVTSKVDVTVNIQFIQNSPVPEEDATDYAIREELFNSLNEALATHAPT